MDRNGQINDINMQCEIPVPYDSEKHEAFERPAAAKETLTWRSAVRRTRRARRLPRTPVDIMRMGVDRLMPRALRSHSPPLPSPVTLLHTVSRSASSFIVSFSCPLVIADPSSFSIETFSRTVNRVRP